MNIEPRENLLSELKGRISNDDKRARRLLGQAEALVWLAVISSFGTAIAAAIDAFPSWLIAITAAIPGIVIVADRSLGFYRRARWHNEVATKLQALARALEYEGADHKDISKQFSSIMIDMEPKYPGINAGGLSEPKQNQP